VPGDPLAGLAALAEVEPALVRARAATDRAYRLPALRRHGGRLAAQVSLRAAVASAALAGSRHELADVRAGTVTDPVLQGALRCAEALPALVDRWRQTPRQVLARLHLLAARDVVEQPALGRPVAEPAVAARLAALVEVVLGPGGAGAGRAVPGLLRASVVHGELLALRAFPGPYGVVARAAGRLELMASGFDPRGLVLAEELHLAREPEYVGSAGAFATGTPDGVRAWLRHCAVAAEQGADALAELAGAVAG
jgi:hypothetical protein